MNREVIMTAFCNKIFAMADFRTTGRRVLGWKAVNDQPACFVRNVKDEYMRHGALPPKVTMHVEVWLYTKGSSAPESAPGAALNNLLDALDAALAVTGADIPFGKQRLGLGNAVEHCWIEGEVIYDPGDLDQQAKAVVPVRILVPT